MQFPNRIRVGSTIFYARLRPYQIDRVRGQLALCFNEQRQRDTRESRRDEIADICRKLFSHSKREINRVAEREQDQGKTDAQIL
jgi:hypothetical protein